MFVWDPSDVGGSFVSDLLEGATEELHERPATVDPGEAARVDVIVPASCAGPSGPVSDVAIVVLGRAIPVSSLEAPAECPVAFGRWYVIPPLLNVPHLMASIEAPRQVRRGADLRYSVTITNTSDGHVAFEVRTLSRLCATDRCGRGHPSVELRGAGPFPTPISAFRDEATDSAGCAARAGAVKLDDGSRGRPCGHRGPRGRRGPCGDNQLTP